MYYMTDETGISNEKYNEWQRMNAVEIARAAGPFAPFLKQRLDGFLTVQYIVDQDILHFEDDGKYSVNYVNGHSDVFSLKLSQDRCLKKFNDLASGEATLEVRQHMAHVVGNDFTNLPGDGLGDAWGRAWIFRNSGRANFVDGAIFGRTGEELVKDFKAAKKALAEAETEEQRITATRILYRT